MIGEFLAWAPWWLLVIMGYVLGDLGGAYGSVHLWKAQEDKAKGNSQFWHLLPVTRSAFYGLFALAFWVYGVLKLIGVV